MAETKQKIKRIFEIPHFFKDREGNLVRNVLIIDELPPYRGENGFIKQGKIIIRILDEKGNFKAFRLNVPEVLELNQILEMLTKEQLKKIRLLNAERITNLKSKRGAESE